MSTQQDKLACVQQLSLDLQPLHVSELVLCHLVCGCHHTPVYTWACLPACLRSSLLLDYPTDKPHHLLFKQAKIEQRAMPTSIRLDQPDLSLSQIGGDVCEVVYTLLVE